MIEEILIVVDVAIVLVDAVAETSREVYPEILKLGVFIVLCRDTLPLTVFQNTRSPAPE